MRRLLLALPLLFAACDPYDPPPSVTLEPPPGGRWVPGDPLVLRFSEPIAPETLVLHVWPNKRTIEGELEEGLTRVLQDCTVEACGASTIAVAADGTSATVRFDPVTIGKPDVPWALEIDAELTDRQGNDRGVPAFFDFQFAISRRENLSPVAFERGNYVIVAELTSPLPVVLTLLSDVAVLEDGNLALVGADGDENPGFPRNTLDPAGLHLDTSDEGFALHIGGFVTLSDEGERFLDTDPITVALKVGPLTFEIREAILSGKIVTADDGHDRLEGTLTFSSAVLDPGTPDEFAYEGGATAFTGIWAAPDAMPEGTPDLCTAICGGVQGICEVPPNFPPVRFCEETP